MRARPWQVASSCGSAGGSADMSRAMGSKRALLICGG
jgi:hypothetical protein